METEEKKQNKEPAKIRRFHIPCPNCGFCSHLYTAAKGQLPKEPPAEDDKSCEDFSIFELPIEDISSIGNGTLICANCETPIEINIIALVTLSIPANDKQQNAPTSGSLQ